MSEFYQRSPKTMVAAWSPVSQADVDAGKPQVFTQVHVQLTTDLGLCVLRFKSNEGLAAFIADLEAERRVVWGDK